MNIIALYKTLKDIKLDELDDDVYLYILKTANASLPLENHINSEMDGVALNEHYQKLPPDVKMKFLDVDLINGHAGDLVESIRRVEEDRRTKQTIEDSSKGTVIASIGVTGTVITLIGIFVYVITGSLRGTVPDSMVLSFLNDLISTFLHITQGGDQQ